MNPVSKHFPGTDECTFSEYSLFGQGLPPGVMAKL